MKAFAIAVMAAGLLGAGVPAWAADAEEPVDSYSDGTADGTAAGSFYVRGDLGWSFLDWSGGDDDNAPAFGGGVGYQINDNLRADIRADWAGDYETAPGADMSITTVLGNLYFDWANESMLTPYVGAGFGYGWTDVDGGPDDDGAAFALMGGVSVDLTESVKADVGYRFRDVLISGDDPFEHQVLGGIRFGF